MGAALPDSDHPSQSPTPAEVRAVCATVHGFNTEFSVRAKSKWQAVIQDRKGDECTILNVQKYKGAENKPHSISFEKGPPSLILEIVKRLAKQCGPLVVFPDSAAPIAVTSTASVKKLLKMWGVD
jgi:hypothetical protein